MNRHEETGRNGPDAYDRTHERTHAADHERVHLRDHHRTHEGAHDIAPVPPDAVTAARAARCSALLNVALADDSAVRDSAARMRPVVLQAAVQAEAAARRRRMLKAAVLIIAVGSVITVPPARAWVADQVRLLADRLTGDAALPPPALPAPVLVTPADADVSYTFDVAGAVLVVTLDAPAGSVEVVRQSDDVARATAEALAAPGTQVLVQPGGLVITSAGATASSQFRITVPAGVEVVRVAHGGATVELRPGEGWRVR